ncbi:MAG: Short-chain dehydrogenase/reductase SDR [uncultured Truepera sp.]|uniref:Short-chain dehydrogenase/reductase SDR n=1 Tax=uncultured Truepera sp. TaxID=543023 RepID=A0A6J4USK5_9DEIN|nr:MAG: Short-chain dehydrogenase/reductase SDR [uncultured Truepera sp.]
MSEVSTQTVTLVTGANKGLGFETARRLKAHGHKVYIGARDKHRGQTAADELGVAFVQLDVTDEASVAKAAAELERLEGRLDVLVNNVGIPGPHRNAEDLTADDTTEVFDTNVVSAVRVTHAFLPLLERSDSPAIVNVTSGLGSFAVTQDPSRIEFRMGMPLYSASKAALTMLTTEYAKLLPHIRVNAADPGYTATDFNGNSGPQTVTEGTDAIVRLATLDADGPTGTYIDRYGTVAW